MTLWRQRGWFCRLLNTAWPVCTPDLCAAAFSQESFSRQNEASVERPEGFKMFLGHLGTFFNRFRSRKTSNSWNYVKNCPAGLNFRSQNFCHQSNSLIYEKCSYRKTTGPISTIFGPKMEEKSGHILLNNGCNSLQIVTVTSETKSEF